MRVPSQSPSPITRPRMPSQEEPIAARTGEAAPLVRHPSIVLLIYLSDHPSVYPTNQPTNRWFISYKTCIHNLLNIRNLPIIPFSFPLFLSLFITSRGSKSYAKQDIFKSFAHCWETAGNKEKHLCQNKRGWFFLMISEVHGRIS